MDNKEQPILFLCSYTYSFDLFEDLNAFFLSVKDYLNPLMPI